MAKSSVVIPEPNKGGRPATGRDPVRAIRLSNDFLARVDAWSAGQDDQPGRSEAIRRLVELGLAAAPKPTIKDPVKRAARSAKARKAAEAAIDKVLAAKPPERRPRRSGSSPNG